MSVSPRNGAPAALRPPPGLPLIRRSDDASSAPQTNAAGGLLRTMSASNLPPERPVSPQPLVSPNTRGPNPLQSSGEKPVVSPAKFRPRDETCMQVKNLPDNVTAAEVLSEFSRHGKIARINVQRGGALVEYEAEESLERALSAGQSRLRDRTYLTCRATPGQLRVSVSDLRRSGGSELLSSNADMSAGSPGPSLTSSAADAVVASSPPAPHITQPAPTADVVRVELRTWKALVALNTRLALNIVALDQKLEHTTRQLTETRSELADNNLLLVEFRKLVDQVHAQNAPSK